MKKILGLTVLTLALTGTALTQESKTINKESVSENKKTGKLTERKPFEWDSKPGSDENDTIKRGNLIGNVKEVSLAKVLKKPADYVGKSVLVKGVIVRSCKMEGCWMEIAPTKDAKSVRVTFKDHKFFIPLDAAGLNAKAEGVFSVKTLSKKEVEHLVNEDGAKFDNINKDGTVTEVSFEATGVELTKK